MTFITHKILLKTFRKHRCLSKKHKPLTKTFRKHPRFSIKTKFLRYFQNTQNLNGNFSPNHKSAPDCTFTKRRQLREVSTPNRDVWRGAALSGTNQRRCVKTERRRRAVARPLWVVLRGGIGGFRIKSPYSDADTEMKISTNSQRPKPKDQKPIAFIIHKILSKTFRNYRCLSKKHKTLSKSFRKHRRLSKNTNL